MLIEKDVFQVFHEVYNNQWYILGKALETFEKDFADYLGLPNCVGVANGLDALTLSLLACGIGEDDEVIVPAHTYIATWIAVSRVGARPVPVEPHQATFNIDVQKIEAAITSKTKAIIPVHLYGQACDMTAIDALARRYQLHIIEDNAQAHGARWLQKRTGSYGVINAVSFYPTKNLGALGDGGAVVTSSKEMADFVKIYRNYGLERKNVSRLIGMNSRLDEIQAAILSIKLKHLDAWNDLRRNLASLYLSALHNVQEITLPLADKEAHHVYHLFVIRTKERDALQEHLQHSGIETMVHYPIPPHLQQSYRDLGYGPGDFPLTEEIARTALSLPLWPGMTEEQVSRISDAIRQFFK